MLVHKPRSVEFFTKDDHVLLRSRIHNPLDPTATATWLVLPNTSEPIGDFFPFWAVPFLNMPTSHRDYILYKISELDTARNSTIRVGLLSSELSPHLYLLRIANQLNPLLLQLSQHSTIHHTAEGLRELVTTPNTFLFLALDGNRVIGTAALVNPQTLLGDNPWLGDVVVDQVYRGQGIGTMLVEANIEHARKLGYKRLMLTSRPERESTNHLYQKLGFEEVETNVRCKLL
jgi:GNAT superfamily N-acetyltransferase